MSKTNLKQTKEEAEIKVPADLQEALAAEPSAEAVWNDLTPLARWDFIHWVDTAKQAKTRQRRIRRTCEMLPSGKRRPCCYSVVPMDLYRALDVAPKAKTQWGKLTPMERRGFISSIDVAQQADEHRLRVKQACDKLAAGKRRP